MLSCSKENSETLVRKPAERDAAEQKPTPIRKGHWRNRWEIRFYRDCPNCSPLGDGTHLGCRRYVSAEIAEQDAIKQCGNNIAHLDGYRGPVFFPEEGSGS